MVIIITYHGDMYIYMYILSYVCTYHMYDTYVYILYDIRGTRIPSMNTD